MHPLAAQWDFEGALNGHLLQMGEPHAWTSASKLHGDGPFKKAAKNGGLRWFDYPLVI